MPCRVPISTVPRHRACRRAKGSPGVGVHADGCPLSPSERPRWRCRLGVPTCRRADQGVPIASPGAFCGVPPQGTPKGDQLVSVCGVGDG